MLSHYLAWGCRQNNPNGKTLKKHSDKNGINIFSPEKTTYYDARFNVQPDICLINFPTFISNRTEEDLTSDHFPTIIYLDDTKTNNKKEFRKTDWVLYANIIEVIHSPLPPIKGTAEIEDAVNKIQDSMIRHLIKPRR